MVDSDGGWLLTNVIVVDNDGSDRELVMIEAVSGGG